MEKIYFPKEGYTKGDVVSYYEKISKYILPYLIDHPQSLNPFPNGIEGKSFFQKDMTDTPSWIRTVKVFSPSEERTINYMLCQNEASLLYMANLGCIELNIWNSSIKDLDKPDYMVFDIDPQNLPFESAVQVAKATKVVLDEIKIKGFCKTSGSRGLHIFVPLGNKYSFDQVKEFSRLVNLIVNKRLPEITSIERKPELRNRKVYLDYLQNRKGQTMAAAYCLRPRNGAPVSAPIDWNELNEKLDPLSFNIETIFRRLEEKGDLWKGFFDKKNRANLKRALGTLEKIIAKQKNQL